MFFLLLFGGAKWNFFVMHLHDRRTSFVRCSVLHAVRIVLLVKGIVSLENLLLRYDDTFVFKTLSV